MSDDSPFDQVSLRTVSPLSVTARNGSPFVVCLTNTVAANFTANVLLAIGAKPAMVEDPSEAAELAAVADAVLVNVGTLTASQAEAMRAAVRACNAGSVPSLAGSVPRPFQGFVPSLAGSVPTFQGSVPSLAGSVPWVLDPVALQALGFRRAFVNELLLQKPTAIRGNQQEIEFLLGSVPKLTEGSVPKLTEGSVPDLMGSVPSLATGEVDVIRRGAEVVVRVTGGVPMLQSVTATGCAQGAVVAALLGWGQTPVEALVSASRLMKRAGERAWERAKTPGSFQIALLDALWDLTHGETGDERREGRGRTRDKK